MGALSTQAVQVASFLIHELRLCEIIVKVYKHKDEDKKNPVCFGALCMDTRAWYKQRAEKEVEGKGHIHTE